MSITKPPEAVWLTTRQAAEYIGQSEWTVRQKMARGDIKAHRIGRCYRTTCQWLDDYVKKG